MSKGSYIRGFCKAASAAGVDPRALAKYAAGEAPASDIPYADEKMWKEHSDYAKHGVPMLLDPLMKNPEVKKQLPGFNYENTAYDFVAGTNALTKARRALYKLQLPRAKDEDLKWALDDWDKNHPVTEQLANAGGKPNLGLENLTALEPGLPEFSKTYFDLGGYANQYLRQMRANKVDPSVEVDSTLLANALAPAPRTYRTAAETWSDGVPYGNYLVDKTLSDNPPDSASISPSVRMRTIKGAPKFHDKNLTTPQERTA